MLFLSGLDCSSWFLPILASSSLPFSLSSLGFLFSLFPGAIPMPSLVLPELPIPSVSLFDISGFAGGSVVGCIASNRPSTACWISFSSLWLVFWLISSNDATEQITHLNQVPFFGRFLNSYCSITEHCACIQWEQVSHSIHWILSLFLLTAYSCFLLTNFSLPPSAFQTNTLFRTRSCGLFW